MEPKYEKKPRPVTKIPVGLKLSFGIQAPGQDGQTSFGTRSRSARALVDRLILAEAQSIRAHDSQVRRSARPN